MQSIATYAADGTRLRNYPLSSIEYLLGLDEIEVRRNSRGHITKAFFRPTPTSSSMQQTALMGQSYSYEQLLPSGHHAWKHRNFVSQEDEKDAVDEGVDPKELEEYIRNTFRSVALSVLAQPPAKAPSNVVAIDSVPAKRAAVRKRGRNSFRGPKIRPIEFDSERHAA